MAIQANLKKKLNEDKRSSLFHQSGIDKNRFCNIDNLSWSLHRSSKVSQY